VRAAGNWVFASSTGSAYSFETTPCTEDDASSKAILET
jgi:hypothetical protein